MYGYKCSLAGSGCIVGDFHEKAGRVKQFFWSCYSYSRLTTNGRHSLAFSPSFLERFLFGHRYSRSPTSGRRTVRFLQQLPSPTRLLPSALFCGVLTPVPAGCSQFGTGAAVSEPNWISLFPATSSLARVAVTRTRRLGQTLSGSYLLSLLP